MSISEKIKPISNKIKHNKAHYNLDRQTAKVSASSSENISKYEFLTGNNALPEKDLLEKTEVIKRFEYFLLGKELKAQTDIAKKQHKNLDNTCEFQTIKKEEATFKNYN